MLSRHEFVKGPPRPVAMGASGGLGGQGHSPLETTGPLYKAFFSQCESEVLEAIEPANTSEPSRDMPCDHRSDDDEPVDYPYQGESYAMHAFQPNAPRCSSRSCAARRASAGLLTVASHATASQQSESRDAASVACGATGAFNELVASLRRSIPSRVR